MSEANKHIGGITSLYTALALKGLYLPKRTSDCITADYLLGVAFGKFQTMNSEKSGHGIPIQKVSKIQIYDFLKKSQTSKPLGFNQQHLPDKQWMLDLLQMLKPNHQIFKFSVEDLPTELTQQELSILKQLDTSHFRCKRVKFFKLNKYQKIQRKFMVLRNQKEKIFFQLQRLKEMTQIKQSQYDNAEQQYNNCLKEITEMDDPNKMQVENAGNKQKI